MVPCYFSLLSFPVLLLVVDITVPSVYQTGSIDFHIWFFSHSHAQYFNKLPSLHCHLSFLIFLLILQDHNSVLYHFIPGLFQQQHSCSLLPNPHWTMLYIAVKINLLKYPFSCSPLLKTYNFTLPTMSCLKIFIRFQCECNLA